MKVKNHLCCCLQIQDVSYSQEGAGAFLTRAPDITLPDSIIDSPRFLAGLQRRAGLAISALKAHYDAADLAHPQRLATDYERLGDYAINSGNKTARHQGGLYAVHTAMRAVTRLRGRK